MFGYISEVNADQIAQDTCYAMGDYIGISGLEKTYEKHLRGTKGKRIVLVDNKNRIKGSSRTGHTMKKLSWEKIYIQPWMLICKNMPTS